MLAVCGFEGCQQEVVVEQVDEVFGFFAVASPEDGTPASVDFHHVFFRLFFGVSEHAAEGHGDIAHQVDGVVVDDDIPDAIEESKVFFGGVFFDQSAHF